MSNWRNEPASCPQLTAIRDFYADAIGWNNSVARVQSMKLAGITKGEASDELKRLHGLKIQGQWTGPIDN